MTKVTSGVAIVTLVVVAWIGMSLTGTNRVRASNFTVMNLDDSGDGSLRQAILDANANPGADTIDFQDELSGTIPLTSGELLITDGVTINGPGVFAITVSGTNSSRVFDIAEAVTATISGLTISDGKDSNQGGGIINDGALTLANVVVSGNTVTGPTGVGGGIFNTGTVTITNSTLSGNSAFDGGGALNGEGVSVIYLMTITNSTISGNTATNGGGIFNNNNSTLTMTNCTVSGNSATTLGGGILNNGTGSTANIRFVTIAGNSASSGGGISNNTGGTVNIKNSIVANSTSGGDCSNAGTLNVAGKNLTTDGTCPGLDMVPSTGTGGLNLGPLQDNGGPTQTHALLPGSVAIDAAPDCTDVFVNPDRPKVGAPKALVTTDQRGVGRPQGSACDVGAYELVPCTTTPTVICPESFTTSTDATHCSAVVDFTPAANCPCENGGGRKPSPSKIVGVKAPVAPNQGCMVSCAPASGSTFPLGTTTVTCTASDSFGNTSEPCSFTITVTDQTPPAVSCPANITKSTDPDQCSAVVNYTATANDNCDGPLTPTCEPASGSTFQKGTTTVTCTATDSLENTGSCSFTVTVNDTQQPSITCPANITKPTDPNLCSAVVTYPAPTVSDNCPDVGTATCSPASGSTFPKGTTTVTCSVSDASNNMAGCSFTVTVQDTIPPTITCPANVTQCNDTNQCSAVVSYPAPGVNDNCPNATAACSPASGSSFPKGTTTVTCTATDAAGNQSSPCTFTVTVNDCQNPTITCPANITRGTDPNQCSAVVSYPPPAVSDNCPGVGTPTCAPASGSTFPKGTTTVSCSVKDAVNNSASCSFTVTVNDTQPPSITCPANVTKPTDPNLCSAVVTYPAPAVSDNCPGVGVPTCSPASGSTFPKGTTTVTCSVKDASNNMSACSFTVTVQDTQPPTITCPPNITFVAAATCPPTSSMPVNFTVTASDNCPGVTVVCRNQDGVVVTSGLPFPVGTTTVTCTATDTSGNTTACSFTISGFNFCLQDEDNPGNVVLINALTGDYRFCCGGVPVATGRGTLTTRGCIGSIDDAKGDRRVHIQWDTSANGAGAGTAIVQVSPNKTICQITDKKMTNNNCVCSNSPPAAKK